MTRVVLAGEDRAVEVADAATFADAIDAVGCDPQTATALVDGAPRPADAPITDDVDRVTVLRLIRGG